MLYILMVGLSMKLLNLIKCHLSYLLSKSSIVSMLIVLIILSFVYVTNALSVDSASYKENINTYYYSSVTITKVINCMLSCFIMSSFYSRQNDAYICLIITSGIKKEQYYLTKLSSIVFVLFFNLMLLCLLFLLSGFLFIKGFVYDVKYVRAFYCIFICTIIYSLYANILVNVFHNMFTFLVPALLSILSTSLSQGNINIYKKLLFIIAPVSLNSLDKMFYNNIIYILIIIVLIIISLLVYVKADRRSE